MAYRPPGWVRHGREGAVEVADTVQLLIIEGVGASRTELTDWLDAACWVQSDFAEAERRGIARDIASGVNGDADATIAFWHTWMAEELPFFERDRPWERADSDRRRHLRHPTAGRDSCRRSVAAWPRGGVSR